MGLGGLVAVVALPPPLPSLVVAVGEARDDREWPF
jgi:hypothetical protein